MADINKKIDREKTRVFGDRRVEIKSYYLRNPGARRRQYLQKHGLSFDVLRDFVDNFWYKILEDNQDSIQIQAIVLYKRYYSDQRHRRSPLDITTVALLDRLERHPSRQCQIMFDQMESGIRSTRGDQGRILQIANKSINLDSFQGGAYSHIDVKFGQSDLSNFLQLADTVAYNIRRQFVDFGHQLTPRLKLPGILSLL